MTNMWDLTGTTVAANYRRVYASSQLGTRALRFIRVKVQGGTPPDFTVNTNSSDSDFSKAVLCLQNYGEVWMIGAPNATEFIAVVSDDTAQDSNADTNVIGGYGQAEANIYAALGSWASGSVTVYYGTWSGGSISWAST